MFSQSIDARHTIHTSPGGSEPMSLGSPVSSPTRNNQTNVSFLPPYLIRETPPHLSPISTSFGDRNSNTTYVKQPATNSYSLNQISPITSHRSRYESPASNSMNQVLNSPNVGKAGPPVQGLFDSLSTPPPRKRDFSRIEETTPKTPVSTFRLHDSQPHNGTLTPTRSFLNSSSVMSPAQIDPFYTQGESLTPSSKLDESWITIFGFPPAATQYMLQQFSHYGNIVEQKCDTEGNWIHIKYQSKLQAKKALSKNGKIFSGNIMVGVKTCIEMDLMNETGKENSHDASNSNFCQDNFDHESLDTSRRSLRNVRPLTNIYRTPNSDAEASPMIKKQSQANGFVSKAMAYVMKW